MRPWKRWREDAREDGRGTRPGPCRSVGNACAGSRVHRSTCECQAHAVQLPCRDSTQVAKEPWISGGERDAGTPIGRMPPPGLKQAARQGRRAGSWWRDRLDRRVAGRCTGQTADRWSSGTVHWSGREAHSHPHTRTRARTRTYPRAPTHANTLTRRHTRRCTQTQTHADRRTQARTQARTRPHKGEGGREMLPLSNWSPPHLISGRMIDH